MSTEQRDQHLFGPGPKRILSLDGGGVRGLITLGMLKQVERLLRARSENPSAFRLSDYFDLIGGTSTGALIAAMLAMGLSVDRIVNIYLKMIPEIFQAPSLTRGFHAKFDSSKFEKALDATIDTLLREDLGRPDLLETAQSSCEPRLGSDVLKTGLAVVAKRIDTNSVWTLTNNPRSKYWAPNNEFWNATPADKREVFHPNRDYSLRQVLQASASAPYFLDAVSISIEGEKDGLFVDGGATPHNNPAAELFLHTTLRDHDGNRPSPTGFGWDTGADNIYLLSLGTGAWTEKMDHRSYRKLPALGQAFRSVVGMIGDGEQLALTWLQAISEPADPQHIDGNLGTLEGLRVVPEALLTFQRFNPVLELTWLEESLGFQFDMNASSVARMRELDVKDLSNLNRCFEVGLETGRRLMKPKHFPREFDIQLAQAA